MFLLVASGIPCAPLPILMCRPVAAEQFLYFFAQGQDGRGEIIRFRIFCDVRAIEIAPKGAGRVQLERGTAPLQDRHQTRRRLQGGELLFCSLGHDRASLPSRPCLTKSRKCS
jgi:hypothetical protein